MSANKHVLIVGGGVVGLCCAYYALQWGHRVTVLERGGAGHDACSLGNAGMVVPSHFIPLAAPGMVSLGLRMMLDPAGPFTIRPQLRRELLEWGWRFYRAANRDHVERSAPLLRDLNGASKSGFEELAAALPDDFGLVGKGLLMLCKTERTLHEEAEVAEMAHRLGVPAEVLTPAAAAALEPGLKLDIAGAVYFPLDCHLIPERLVAALTRALEAGGATLCYSTEVTGWRTDGGRIAAARTPNGEMSADEYVVAGGSWSAGMLRDLGLRLPLQAGKGYSFTLPQPRRQPSICSILTEARVAVTPMGSSLRFAGTMEVAGLDLSVNRARAGGMFKSIPRYFPEFAPSDFEGLPVWSGLRPCSPDGLPYIGRFARYPNLIAATGHSMMGVSLAPVTGKLVAEIASGEAPSLDIAALRPDRYDRRNAP